jgi:hypothetical protein
MVETRGIVLCYRHGKPGGGAGAPAHAKAQAERELSQIIGSKPRVERALPRTLGLGRDEHSGSDSKHAPERAFDPHRKFSTSIRSMPA